MREAARAEYVAKTQPHELLDVLDIYAASCATASHNRGDAINHLTTEF